MALRKHDVDFRQLSEAELAEWRKIPAAIVSDCMDRTHVMAAAIKPVGQGMRICGQARTATCMAGDNMAPHRLIGMARPGEVIVIDGRGAENVAIWGGIMTTCAIQRKLGGLVIDGAVRDVAEIREKGFPAFASAIVPAGPHKNYGGIIDGTISCGACPVRPGDLVIGDDDGVAVVPLEWVDAMLKASKDKIAAEDATLARIAKGEATADILGLPMPETIKS